MLAAIYLGMTLAAVCPAVRDARAQGWTSEQMRTWAREHSVPERVIRWAEKNC